jgi:hypothetical protein
MNPNERHHPIRPEASDDSDGLQREISVETYIPTEEKQEVIDFLIENSVQIAEGSNGIVLRFEGQVNDEDFSEIVEILEEIERRPENIASKLIKIQRGDSDQQTDRTVEDEYIRQRKAFEYLQDNSDESEEYAIIPEPLDYSELEEHHTVGDTEVSEALVMDYVDGIDLARYLFEEVAELHHDLDLSREDIRNYDFDKLIRKVLFESDLCNQNISELQELNNKDSLQNQIINDKILGKLKNRIILSLNLALSQKFLTK